MENVKIIMVYNLIDPDGNKLQLRLGSVRETLTRSEAANGDTGFRWSFVGRKIPMPVRAYTWFNGFPVEIMLDWLKGNGWYPHTCISVDNYKCNVYELPKGNESVNDEYPIHPEQDEAIFNDILRELVANHKRCSAVRAYRYAHGGTFGDAINKVREICGGNWY